jgi:hypothetical protein
MKKTVPEAVKSFPRFPRIGGGWWGGAKWSSFTKDHGIEVSVRLDDDGWFVSLFIYYHEKLQTYL